jgi:hypothetical protein
MSFSEDEQPVAVRPEQPVEEELADRLAPLPGGRRIAGVLGPSPTPTGAPTGPSPGSTLLPSMLH